MLALFYWADRGDETAPTTPGGHLDLVILGRLKQIQLADVLAGHVSVACWVTFDFTSLTLLVRWNDGLGLRQ